MSLTPLTEISMSFTHMYFYILLVWHQVPSLNPCHVKRATALITVCTLEARPHSFNSDSDLFEKPDDILAHVRQADNDVVVVDVAESGVVFALTPGLIQDQIPAVHSGQEILVFPETAMERFC